MLPRASLFRYSGIGAVSARLRTRISITSPSFVAPLEMLPSLAMRTLKGSPVRTAWSIVATSLTRAPSAGTTSPLRIRSTSPTAIFSIDPLAM
jgi:hypothetical protein